MQFHSSYKCTETFLSLAYMYTTLQFLGKRVTEKNLTKGYSQTLKKKKKKKGREFQRDAPAKDMLVLNESSLGLGT